MASHVTYDGVTGAGGNIFRGFKFWVSLSVPQRSSIVEKIESNGGVVVPREKDADMLIADHAKSRTAPPGSISWNFIRDSVNAGIIQVEDRYLIEPPTTQRQPILAGSHARRTRTPFSESDDALVAKFVLKKGINTAGNEIYKELANKFDHHTWQSWRNRWVKYLSFKSNEELDRLARLANVDLGNAPITAQHLIRRHEREERPQPPRPNAAPSAGSEPFQDRTTPSPRVSRVSTSEAARRPDAIRSDRPNGKSHTEDAAPEPSGETAEEETPPIHDTADLDEAATAKDDEAGEDVPEEDHERGQEDAGAQLEGEQGEEGTQDDVSVDGGLSSFSERDQFFSDLQDYCDANEKRLHTRCVIKDHEVDLFDLYQAVSAQSLPPDEVDWKQVAEDVGLGHIQSKERTASLLHSTYNHYLADFAEAMMSFEDNEEDPDEDIAEEEGLFLGDEENGTSSNTPRPFRQDRVPSSMLGDFGETALSKRLPDERPSTPEKFPKRRRTMPTEIPMTPEDKLRITKRPSAPSSAPGNLDRIIDEEQAGETEELPLRTPRQQPPLDESLEMTPSQQLRSETELAVNAEHDKTPTLYYSPSAARPFQRNDGRLETIPEEVPSAYTPTRSQSKKRALPPSFEQARPTPSQELREKQLKEELQREESRRRDERQPHEEDRGGAPQQQLGNGQEQRPPLLQQVAVDSSDPDEENIEENKKQFKECKRRYLSKGFSEAEIIEAMRRTTMTPGETMDIVLNSLRAGRGIPENYQGIWTDRDDSQLKYVVRVGGLEGMPGDIAERQHREEKAWKMLQRLMRKHGEAGVELRKKFLREVALAQEEMERGLQA